jgi:hypothetical protein
LPYLKPYDEKIPYQAPRVTVIGTVHEMTQQSGCQKQLGGSDGFIFQGTHLVCRGS